MPYDLYGTYYKSSREAEAAELSQMNEIDNRYLHQQVKRLERQHDPLNSEIWQYIQMLEERIKALEDRTQNTNEPIV
jgi:hypothetical protein